MGKTLTPSYRRTGLRTLDTGGSSCDEAAHSASDGAAREHKKAPPKRG